MDEGWVRRIIDNEAYPLTCPRYSEPNPVRARMDGDAEALHRPQG
jgi:hypothetical protein